MEKTIQLCRDSQLGLVETYQVSGNKSKVINNLELLLTKIPASLFRVSLIQRSERGGWCYSYSPAQILTELVIPLFKCTNPIVQLAVPNIEIILFLNVSTTLKSSSGVD